MQTVSIVFAVTAAIAAGLLICLQGLKDIIGQHKWLSSIKFLLCLLVLFNGPVGAADATFWSFIVGGVFSCAAVGLLCFRVECKRRQRKWVGERLSNLRPGVTIALERYPGVGPEFANELPIPLLRRVFETRLAECQQLSFEDFKTEYLCDMSFYDMSGFATKSALLIFVEPTQLKECQRWFVESTTLWKKCMAAKGKKLILPIRFIWTNNALNEAIRSSITLYALSHMNEVSKKALCQALFSENPENTWIHDNLPKPSNVESELPCKDAGSSVSPNVDSHLPSGDVEVSVPNEKEATPRPVVAPLEDGSLKKWSTMGKHSQCRFCRFRPSDIKFVSKVIGKTVKHVYPWARVCGACEHNTMEFGLVEDKVARNNVTAGRSNAA